MALKRILLLLSGLALLGGLCEASARGQTFVTAFMKNSWQNLPNAKFQLLITGYHPATSVTVTVTNLKFERTTSVNEGQTMSVELPASVEMLGTGVFAKAVLIQADKDISVVSHNYKNYSSGVTVVYPVQLLGSLYYVVTPVGDTEDTLKEFAIVTSQVASRVDIHLKGSVTFKGRVYPAGSRLVVDLKAFQAVQLQSTADLSGTRVESGGPVAVLSGHSCAKKYSACDHVVEQLLPVSSWGTSFIVPPLSFQASSDIVYVVASQDTVIQYRFGPAGSSQNVEAGQVLQIDMRPSEPLHISADTGIQVLLFFTGVKRGTRMDDPFLINIASLADYCSSYHMDGISHFDNYAVIVAKNSEYRGIAFKNKAAGNLRWKPIPGMEYSWAEHRLDTGSSSLEHANTPFGLFVFGITYLEGYGSMALCPSSKRPPSCSRTLCGKNEKCEIRDGNPVCVPQAEPALSTCWAFGDPHYQTFDGKYFDFMGTCTYTLAKTCTLDASLPSFSVEVKNENRGNTRVSYVGLVTIRVYGIIISVARKETGFVRVNNQRFRLPISLHEGKLWLYPSGSSVFIGTNFSLRVSYDWNSYLVVKIPRIFSENICGLCGDYNGDPADDFTVPDGTLAPSPVEFGQSWKVEDGDRVCWHDCHGQCKSCPPEISNNYKVESSCGLISKGEDGPFRQCHSVIDPEIYLENCVHDLCLNDGLKGLLCEALKIYAEACQREGVVVSDWRRPTGCSLTCPPNSQYKACGSPCPATCNDPAAPSHCSSLPCVESCQCNEGFVLDAGRCIPKAACGCVFEGKLFSPGEQFWGDSTCTRRCTCDPQSKQVTCQVASCRTGEQCKVQDGIQNCYPTSFATCSASGDPHYITFDGQRFNFQGNCVYQVAGLSEKRDDLEDFLVLVQNDRRGSQSVSFTRSVELNVYDTTVVISREHPAKVLVNGMLTNLPYNSESNKMSIYRRGQEAVVQAGSFLTVTFDWQNLLTVTVSSAYAGTLSGLCGNFNGDEQDDMTLKDGGVAPKLLAFVQSWKVREVPGCTDVDPGECSDLPAIEARQRDLGSECGLLLDENGPFRECHSKIYPEAYFQDCIYDYCFFKGQQAVICQVIASYAAACQAAGATLRAWRSDTFCNLPCGPNSHYELCATDCIQTCGSIYAPVSCTAKCQEGCVCDEDFVQSGDQCVPLSRCGCHHDGRYYLAGETFYPTCQQRCECQAGGTVRCEAFSCGPNEECRLSDGIQKCHPVGNATCTVSGGMHYLSFDGSPFDFQGTCVYHLATFGTDHQNLTPFAIEVENGDQGKGKIFVTKMVSVNVYGVTLALVQNKVGQVKVNGLFQPLPVTLSGGRLSAYQHGTKVVIQGNFGLLVSYDLVYHVTVTVPGNYQGLMGGLCGNYNGRKDDEFQLPDGRLISDVIEFGAGWKVVSPGGAGSCSSGCAGDTCLICEESRENVFKRRNHCGILTLVQGPFSACHSRVNPDVYLKNCIYDLCLGNGNRQILFQSIGSYVSACQEARAPVQPWRISPFSPLSCPANSHYEICADLCSASCAQITDFRRCPETCAEGCQCDDGFFFDGLGCVTAESCGYFMDGRYYKPNEKILLKDCLESCTFIPGRGVACEAHSCTTDENCEIQDGVMACVNNKLDNDTDLPKTGSLGKQFITAILQNGDKGSEANIQLFVTGYHNSTTVNVTIHSSMYQKSYPVREGETVSVQIPRTAEMVGSDKFGHSILIESDKDTSVVLLHKKTNSVGTTMVHPVQELGTLYYVVTPSAYQSPRYLKEFAVIAWRAPTSVQIYLKGNVMFNRQLYAAGSTLTVPLEPFQALQLQSSQDLSGTRIQSSEPVAVLSGHTRVKKQHNLDHVLEQLLPASSWGTTFIIPPLSFQPDVDTVYVVAAQNTRVDYKLGMTQNVRHLEEGEVSEFEIQFPQALYISADAGIQVMFFYTGNRREIVYDVFFINIPAIGSYGRSYHLSEIRGLENYITIIAESSKTSRMTRNKRAIQDIQWKEVPGTNYSWGEYKFNAGARSISVEHPESPFGVLAFGGRNSEGYGYAPPPFYKSGSFPGLPTCPENSHYMSCGTACPATCSNPVPPACTLQCAAMCQCNEGYVLSRVDSDVCVPVENCQCAYKGKIYEAGQAFSGDEDCHSLCKCDPNLGEVVCIRSSCAPNKRCRVVGGVRGCYSIGHSTCVGTANRHYTTFDGKKYDFDERSDDFVGLCTYQMVGVCSRDPTLTPFLVMVENNYLGYKDPYFTRALTLEVYNMTISLNQEHPGKIQVNGIVTELPFSHKNQLKAYLSGAHGFIKTDFDLRVSFNWANHDRVIIPDTYANAVCGLCGNANQDLDDDLAMKDGTQAEDAIKFVDRWQLKAAPGCAAGCTKLCPMCGPDQTQNIKSNRYCGILIRKDGPFTLCHDVVEPTPYFEDCVYDTCQHNSNSNIMCRAIGTYVTTCQAQGIQIGPWRSVTFCSFPCPRNSHYELCGNGCPPTCRALSAPEPCEDPCAEGCFCDSGFIRSGDQCVPHEECGCTYRGRYYKQRDEFYSSISCQEKCRCLSDGTVRCWKFSCQALEQCRVENGLLGCYPIGYGVATLSGGPHYVSFDGQPFDFHGSCAYILAKVCDGNPQLANFSVSVEKKEADDGLLHPIKTVMVSVHGHTVVLQRGLKWKAVVDGESYILPVNIGEGKLWLSQEGNNIILQSSFGLTVLYDTSSYIHVSVPETYKGHMCGLGGNFNGDKSDDFMLSSGQLTQSVDEFGTSWKVPLDGASCSDGCGERCPTSSPTQTAQYKVGSSCGMIPSTTGPFRDCHKLVDPAEYAERCLYDMSVANGAQEFLCESLQAYTVTCQAAGAKVRAWRRASFCPLICPANSDYKSCTAPCDVSCAGTRSLTLIQCSANCFEGCQCNEGYWSDGEVCVPSDRCGCVHKGFYLKLGDSVLSSDCTERCTCAESGQVACQENSCQLGETCMLRDGKRSCVRQEGRCRLTPEAQLTSFDGAVGKYFCSGVFDVASVCNQSDRSWFRVSVSIGKSCDDDGLAAGRAMHVFFQNASITVLKTWETWVNGRLVTLPYKIPKAVSVSKVGNGIAVNRTSQVQVHLQPDGEVIVRVDENFSGKLCGPCGNFNGDHSDDQKLPNGEAAEDVTEVLHAWKARDFF